MWKLKVTLVICCIGLCTATSMTKTKVTIKQKDTKEKRDTVTASPYSYEVPQKSFHLQHHHQQSKMAPVEHQSAQKVAPLEYQAIHRELPPSSHQQYVQQEQMTQYHPTTFSAPAQVAHQGAPVAALETIYKGYEDFGYNFPNYEAFGEVPIVHYNGDYDKVNSAIVAVPEYGFKAPVQSAPVKPIQYQAFTYASPASAYSFPAHSYVVPHNSYIQSYAPAANYYSHGGYEQSGSGHSQLSGLGHSSAQFSGQGHPSTGSHSSLGYGQGSHSQTLFVPQTPSAPIKSQKEYAVAKKLNNLPPVSPVPESHSYSKPSYDVPSYVSFTQTERPFKPSAYIGASHVESYADQGKQSEYLKNYVPAKEQQYQIQYVQQPAKTYVAPIESGYKAAQESPKHSYLPPQAPAKNYLPAKVEKQQSSYVPTSSNYLPPNAPYHNQYQQYSSHYAPAAPQQQIHHAHEAYETQEYQVVASHSGHK